METTLPSKKVFFAQNVFPQLKVETQGLDTGSESSVSSATGPGRRRGYSMALSGGDSSSSSATGTPKSGKMRTKIMNNPSRFKQMQGQGFQDMVNGSPILQASPMKRFNYEGPDDKIRRIVSTPKRTADDGLYIYRNLKDTDFFMKFKEFNSELHETDSLIHICKHLGYEKYRAGQVVFKEGDPSNGRLYLVFSGEVSVVVKHLDYITKQNMTAYGITPFSASTVSSTSSHLDVTETPDPEVKTTTTTTQEIKDEFVHIFTNTKKFKNDIPDDLEEYKPHKFVSPFRSEVLWKKVMSIATFKNVKKQGGHRDSVSTIHPLPSPAKGSPEKDGQTAAPKLEYRPSFNNGTTIKDSPFKLVATSSKGRANAKLGTITERKEKETSERKSNTNSVDTSERGEQDPLPSLPPPLKEMSRPAHIQRRSSTSLQRKNSSGSNGLGFSNAMVEKTSIRLESEERRDDIVDISKVIRKYGNAINRLRKGNFFGEKALYSHQHRSATIIANCDCEFLTISEELFNYVKSRFERTNTKKLNFLIDNFPNIEKTKNKTFLENLLYLIEEKPFNLHADLTTEGVKGRNFFVLSKGICNVYKKIPHTEPEVARLAKYGHHETSSKSDGILVCQIFPGTFIGEEIVFNGHNKYEFTVKAASSEVSAIEIDRLRFTVRFPNQVVIGVKKAYQNKADHYLNAGLERAKLKSDLVHLARSPRKKKVNIHPTEINSQDFLAPAPTTGLKTEGDEPEELRSKNLFKKRVVTINKFTHKAPLSNYQKDKIMSSDIVLPVPQKLKIPPSPNKSPESPSTPRNNAASSPILRPELNLTKFDFGSGSGNNNNNNLTISPRSRPLLKISSPRSVAIEGFSPIGSPRENNNEPRETLSPRYLLHPQTASSKLEVEKFRNQLLDRVQRSRQKSKRIGFDPVTYTELPTSPSLTRQNWQLRIKSEPCILDTKVTTFYTTLNTPAKTESLTARESGGLVKSTPRSQNLSQLSPRGPIPNHTLKIWKNKSIEANTNFLPYFKKPTRKKEKSKTVQPTIKQEETNLWKKSITDFPEDKTHHSEYYGSLKLTTVTSNSAAGGSHAKSTKSFLNMNLVSLEADFLSGIVLTEPSASSRFTPRK